MPCGIDEKGEHLELDMVMAASSVINTVTLDQHYESVEGRAWCSVKRSIGFAECALQMSSWLSLPPLASDRSSGLHARPHTCGAGQPPCRWHATKVCLHTLLIFRCGQTPITKSLARANTGTTSS